jgi:hypothetical protein
MDMFLYGGFGLKMDPVKRWSSKGLSVETFTLEGNPAFTFDTPVPSIPARSSTYMLKP